MTNVEPPAEINEPHVSDYRGLYRKCITQKFDSFDEEGYRADVESSMEQERDHRKLINYSIFPFIQSKPAGFRFIRPDPLQELGIKNFDFLLHDLEGKVIAGEAKASISKPQSVVNSVQKQRELFKKHREYLEDNYLGVEMKFSEFVISTYADYSNRVSGVVASEGENIKVWEINRTSNSLNLINSIPEEYPEDLKDMSGKEAIEKLRMRSTHNINSLNTELKNRDTSTGAVHFFPCSDNVDKLRAIVNGFEADGRTTFIDYRKIEAIVQNSAMNYGEIPRAKLVRNIVSLGKEIGLLAEWEDDRGDLKVVSNYNSPDGIEKTLEKKYLNYMVEKEKDKRRRRCKEIAKSVLGQQATLEDFIE